MAGMNLFSLTALLTLDKSDYDKGLKDSQSTFSNFGKSLGNAVKNVTKISAAAVGAGAVAVGKIIKDAVAAYSEYEQLVGGVETLFGAGGKSLEEYAASVGKSVDEVEGKYKALIRGQGKVLDNSKKAFKTAGMSANQYMSVATSFSAALIQSLSGDTKKAAELTDQAIIDMSDNANKMGTDIESIKTAYAGFAKQNYTMLDNLKLGYGGTKKEMERLIEDANRLRKEQGLNADLTIDSYADVIEAIHTVQTEIGITGTTAKEAEGTIQGSLQMTKAAWQNVLVALSGGNIGLKKSIDDLVNSAITSFKNIMPVIMNVLDGFGEVVQSIAPVIAENLPKLVQDVLPKLLDAATQLIGGLIQALPGIFGALQTSIYTIIVNIVEFLNGNGLSWLGDFVTAAGALFDGLIKLFSGDFQGAIDSFAIVFGKLIQGILELFGMDAEQAKNIMFSIVEWIGNAVDTIVNFWNETLKPLFDGIIKFINDVFAGDWKSAWETIKGTFTSIWSGISEFFSGLFEDAVTLIEKIDWKKLGENIWNWISKAFSSVSKWATDTFNSIVSAVEDIDWQGLGTDIWDWITNAFSGIYKWAKDTFDLAVKAIKSIDWAGVGKKIWDWIISAFSKIVDFFKNLFTNTADAIKNIDWKAVGQWIWDTIASAFNTVVEWFTSLFSGAAFQTKNDIDWAGLGNSILDLITSAFDGIWDVFTTIFSNAWDAIATIDWGAVGTAIWDSISNALNGIGDWLYDVFKSPINAIIDGINWMIGGVEDGVNAVIKGINDALTFNWTIPNPFGNDIKIGFSPGLNTVNWGRLERLATGGYLNEGQSAIVGEYRPERLSVVNGHALVQPIGGIQPGDRLGGGSITNYFQIYQQPGEDANAFAERVIRIMTRKQEQRNNAYA